MKKYIHIGNSRSTRLMGWLVRSFSRRRQKRHYVSCHRNELADVSRFVLVMASLKAADMQGGLYVDFEPRWYWWYSVYANVTSHRKFAIS